MKIKALVMRALGEIPQVEEVELSGPKAHEVLVEIAASGICGSDLHVISGHLPEPLPMVLGHEASAIVVEVGPGVTSLSVGDHVVLSITPNCGVCSFCLSGRPNLCSKSGEMASSGTLADGTSRLRSSNGKMIHHFNSVSSFANYAVVPESGAVKIPNSIDLSSAALMSCAVMTGVGAVLNTAKVKKGSKVAVIGCGGIGLNVIQAAKIAGASEILALDVRENSLSVAEKLGATSSRAIKGSQPPKEELSDLNWEFDYVFEAIGNKETIAAGWEMLNLGGALTVVGIVPKGQLLTIDPWGLICEKSLLGCFMGSSNPPIDTARLVDLIDRGELEVNSLASQAIPLEELPAKLASNDNNGIRTVVIPN